MDASSCWASTSRKHLHKVLGMADMNYYLVYRNLSSKWLSVTGTQNKSLSFRRMTVRPRQGPLVLLQEAKCIHLFLVGEESLILSVNLFLHREVWEEGAASLIVLNSLF